MSLLLPPVGEDTGVRDPRGSVVVKRWPHSVRTVGRARRELRRELDGWGMGQLADAAELLVSELLSNAVRHARTPRGRQIETRYERLPHGVRIEVHDANEELPVLRNPDEDSESGRGLALVEAITEGRWGVGKREGTGKLVWGVITDGGAGGQSGGAE